MRSRVFEVEAARIGARGPGPCAVPTAARGHHVRARRSTDGAPASFDRRCACVRSVRGQRLLPVAVIAVGVFFLIDVPTGGVGGASKRPPLRQEEYWLVRAFRTRSLKSRLASL